LASSVSLPSSALLGLGVFRAAMALRFEQTARKAQNLVALALIVAICYRIRQFHRGAGFSPEHCSAERRECPSLHGNEPRCGARRRYQRWAFKPKPSEGSIGASSLVVPTD
jgi:hypothetical protein